MQYHQRRNDFYATLNNQSIEGYHSSHGPNIRYLTGFNGSTAHLLVTGEETFLIVDPRYDHYARELPGEDLSVVCCEESIVQALNDTLDETGLDRLHLERPNLSYDNFLSLKQNLRLADREYGPDRIANQRKRKDDGEIEAIQTAIDRTLPVFEALGEYAKPGKSEREISRFIRSELNKQGEEHAFDPLVLSGERTANPHCPASDRELQSDDVLLVDMGLRVDGYCSDLTRMFFLGNPDPVFEEMYERSKEAAHRAMDHLEPGAIVEDVQAKAHELIDPTDFVTKHSLGHGVGLELHERPRLTSDNRTKLRPGNVVTIEPGVYQDGTGGGRVEYMVLIEEDSFRRLDRSV